MIEERKKSFTLVHDERRYGYRCVLLLEMYSIRAYYIFPTPKVVQVNELLYKKFYNN